MKNLSLKLDDNTFEETEKIVMRLHVNRNRYINKAVHFYNTLHKKRILSKQLQLESQLVQAESLNVLAEFEQLEDESTAI